MSKKINWLKLLRHQQKWTQKQLSDASGVSMSIIAKVELGMCVTSKKNIDKLLSALNTELKNISLLNKF